MTDLDQQTREQVRDRYARAALSVTAGGTGCCDQAGCGPTVLDDATATDVFGAARYEAGQTADLPTEAVLASLGCGNPLAVADLVPGEKVLDLGSGGGIDVLLSARRVGPSGFAYGLDMTDEMLDLARANAARAGAMNVAFLRGHIEDIPLPDQAVDVVISNCVINLSVDKPAVLAEMFRVLVPGGRIGISDVVAEDHLSPADRAERGSHIGCLAGALSVSEYLNGLTEAGFADPEVAFTHEVADGLHGAVIRAGKPASGIPDNSASCCPPVERQACCAPTEKASCCGHTNHTGTCGCR